MKRNFVIAAFIASFLLSLAGQSQAGETKRVEFQHFNDVYEYNAVDGVGGFAQISSMIGEERRRARGSVVTFGGDLLSPSLASNFTQGAHMVEMLNAIGVDAAVIGNHEFDFGPDNLAARIKESRFAWVASNIRAPNGQPFAQSPTRLLIERNGVKIGILGITTSFSPQMSSTGDVLFDDETASAQREVDALKAAGAEVIVALTHLDFEDDRKLAHAVRGIHLILGGHDHDPIALMEGGVLILKAGHDAEYLARAEFAVTRDGGETRVRAVNWRFQSVVGVKPDSKIQAIAAKYDALLAGSLDAPLAKTSARFSSAADIVRAQEAEIGNLFADALRDHFQADAALINGGGIRGGKTYEIGETITRRDILKELPFGNSVVLLEMTGDVLQKALEHGLSGVEKKAGRFLQVSGLSLVYDASAPVGARLLSASVGGKPIEKSALYKIATTDYLAKGGDGYEMLASVRSLVDASAGPLLANVVMNRIGSAKSVAPTIEQRIVRRP